MKSRGGGGLKFNFNIYYLYLNFISFSGWNYLLVEAVKYNSVVLFGGILETSNVY